MKNKVTWVGVLLLAGLVAMLVTRLPVLGLDQAGFCGRCHVMDEQVNAYLHSSHRLAATCGECHDPYNLFTGSAYASYSGARDVARVVTNTIPRQIQATTTSKNIIQNNCLRCHDSMLHEVGDTNTNRGVYCFDCHRHIVHSR